jgi:hypothetical protein
MLSDLRFETAAPPAPATPSRADVACFVGYVGRRGRSLPAAVREQLRAGGWVDGPWQRPEADASALRQVPVTVDSWEAFDRLYLWDRRALGSDAAMTCATYLGAAVRSYFASGGRRAVIVRVGDPWPYLGGDDRSAGRAERLERLVPGSLAGSLPFDPADPRSWRGIQHLCGLPEVSHLCLPDLADACALAPEPPPFAVERPMAPEVFVECSEQEPSTLEDLVLRRMVPPRLDPSGFASWVGRVDAVRAFLSDHRRDVLLVSSLPLPDVETIAETRQAESDWRALLHAIGVLEPVAGAVGRQGAASALIQLVWPWVQTTRADDLPRRLEPPEGLFCGLLARNALEHGTFRSIAGRRLDDVVALEPLPALDLGAEGGPTARLAERVSLIGPEPDGLTLLSDVTGSPDPAWRPGGVSRLMASLLRAARRVGEAHLFEGSGELLWTRIRRSLEALLDDWWRSGGLGGASPGEAFVVRCGRDTMSQNDLDNGRVRVEVTVQPAAAVERIRVVLDLNTGNSQGRLREVV